MTSSTPPPPKVELNYSLYKLKDEAFTAEEKKKAMENLQGYMDYHQYYFLGYQASQHVKYKDSLSNFLNIHLNNIGDPFTPGNFQINTKWIEREVLDYFARLWHAKPRDPNNPNDPDAYWGYVVSMGSTEGNLYAIRNARDYLSGKLLAADLPLPEVEKYQMMFAQTVAAAAATAAGPTLMAAPQLSAVNSNTPIEVVRASGLHQPIRSRIFSGRFKPLYKEEKQQQQQEAAPQLFSESAGAPETVSASAPQKQKKKNNQGSVGDEVRAQNANSPVLFYSEDTHYSISKIKDIVAIPTFYELGCDKYPGQCPLNKKTGGDWPEKVPSTTEGAVDIPQLTELVRFFAKRGYPIAICFNYGTTFKGAYDNVPEAIRSLKPILKKYGLYKRQLEVDVHGEKKVSIRTGFWFHVDGALGAAHTPYLEMSGDDRYNNLPKFDFRNKEVHSISVSGHKQIGAPAPCGLFMTKTKYLLNFATVSYISAQDSTLSGSRSGFSALALWDYFTRHSRQDLINKALRLQKLANYAYDKLKELEKQVNMNLLVGVSTHGLTVRFRQPSADIVIKYSLSCDSLNGEKVAHLFAMEQVTEAVLDNFVEDWKKELLSPLPSAAVAFAASDRVEGCAPRLVYTGEGWR